MDTPPSPGTALVAVQAAPDPVQAIAEPIPCPPGLTALQHAFSMIYVRNGDGNAAKAAARAGYWDPPSAGWRLLHHRGVQDHIRNLGCGTVR